MKKIQTTWLQIFFYFSNLNYLKDTCNTKLNLLILDEITDAKLKEIINKELYKTIVFLEFNKCYNIIGYKFNL